MKIADYEDVLIGLCLRYPHTDTPNRVFAELACDKFGQAKNKTIANAITSLIQRNKRPDIVSVCLALGNNLEICGGEVELHRLKNHPLLLSYDERDDFSDWVRIVDAAGRLRLISLVNKQIAKDLEDIDDLVQYLGTDKVDEFLSNYMSRLATASGTLDTSYRHISVAAEEEKRQLALEQEGQIVDLINIGWPSLSSFLIPRPGSLGVIAGITSMGKTQLALQMMLGAAMDIYENGGQGCIAINELETKGWRLNRRMACALSAIDGRKVALGQLSEGELNRYYDAIDYISQLPIYYNDDDLTTTAAMGWQAHTLHISNKGPLRILITDYIELFADKRETEELRVSTIIRNQKTIVGSTNCCVIAVTQYPNEVLYAKYKIGGIRARYSGAVGQAAHWFVEVYNFPQMVTAGHMKANDPLPDEMERDKAYLLIHKNRDYPIGRVELDWIPEHVQFRDASLPAGDIYDIVRGDF